MSGGREPARSDRNNGATVVTCPGSATRAGLWATEDGFIFFGADAFFLVRVAEPRVDTDGQEALERSVITGHRWWTIRELRATGDRVVPPGLSDLVDTLSSDGVPAAPVRLAWG